MYWRTEKEINFMESYWLKFQDQAQANIQYYIGIHEFARQLGY